MDLVTQITSTQIVLQCKWTSLGEYVVPVRGGEGAGENDQKNDENGDFRAEISEMDFA